MRAGLLRGEGSEELWPRSGKRHAFASAGIAGVMFHTLDFGGEGAECGKAGSIPAVSAWPQCGQTRAGWGDAEPPGLGTGTGYPWVPHPMGSGRGIPLAGNTTVLLHLNDGSSPPPKHPCPC